jgi:hypothetical protein
MSDVRNHAFRAFHTCREMLAISLLRSERSAGRLANGAGAIRKSGPGSGWLANATHGS